MVKSAVLRSKNAVKFAAFVAILLLENKIKTLLASLDVSKSRFFLLVLFKRFFFCLLTPGEIRAFSQLKALISAEVSKKMNRLKRTSKKNRKFETCKPTIYAKK